MWYTIGMKIDEAIKLASDKRVKPKRDKPNWSGETHPTSTGYYITNSRAVVWFMSLFIIAGAIAIIAAAFI